MLSITVENPTTQVIEETFSTGKNTELLIFCCNHIVTLSGEAFADIQRESRASIAADTALDAISRKLLQDPVIVLEHPEYDSLFGHVSRIEHLRRMIAKRLLKRLNEVSHAVQTLLRVLRSLLADQQEEGSAIKNGAAGLRYKITCAAVNGE